jgi:predicted phosphoribosyltransferase
MLGENLRGFAGSSDAIVLGLARGGIPVAFAVAQILSLPLDVFVVRKLGVPGQEELAMGAIAPGGVRFLNSRVIGTLRIPESEVDRVAAKETRELERRENAYRGGRPPPRLKGRAVILVDDGIATGSTILAAIQAIRKQSSRSIVVAAPVAARDSVRHIQALADRVTALLAPVEFAGVGEWYEDFSPTSDDEVCGLLRGSQSDLVSATVLRVEPAEGLPDAKSQRL